jgi:hypothetical protein
MVLLCDVGQVEARFSLVGDSANLDTRWVHGLRGTCNRLENQFAHSRWKLLDEMG